MKFFKNQSPRFRRHGSNQRGATVAPRADPAGDDGSFGSELSEKDQFDILVHSKPKKAPGWRLFEKDDSTCSSITADDKRYYHMDSSDPNYQYRMASSTITRNNNTTSWCCCSGRGTESTIETDNTLLATGRGNREAIPPHVVTTFSANETTDEKQGGCCSLTCCAGSARQQRPVLERPVTKTDKTRKVGTKEPMWAGASLFDALSEDGEERKSGDAKRKWRPRRLWKKK